MFVKAVAVVHNIFVFVNQRLYFGSVVGHILQLEPHSHNDRIYLVPLTAPLFNAYGLDGIYATHKGVEIFVVRHATIGYNAQIYSEKVSVVARRLVIQTLETFGIL